MIFTLILNYKNENNCNLAYKIAEYLIAKNVKIFIPEDKPGFSPDDCKGIDFTGVNAALVIGGDGTILAASRQVVLYSVPILGINMGKVGFLSEVEVKNVFTSLDNLINGNYRIEERMVLEGTVIRDNQVVSRAIAMNDFCVNNGAYARTIEFDVSLKNQHISDYRADGIIVSTSTGSTAYAFSAGGPIVMPEMDLFLLAPICPHNVFSRAIIVPSNETVNIIFRSPSDNANFVADGQLHFSLKKHDHIKIKALKNKVRLIRFTEFAFFDRIKSKLYKLQ